MADTDNPTTTPVMDLSNPFGPPPVQEPVGNAPQAPLTESRSSGRTRLGRGLGALITGRPTPPPDSPNGPGGETPTSLISSTPEPRPRRTGDPQATAKIVVGLVGVSLALGAWVLAQRGRRLRRPTRDQIRDFARPVGAILARHTDLSWLGADIEDLGAAAAVATDYATDGPIAPRIDPVVHVGMPDQAPVDDPTPPAPVYPNVTPPGPVSDRVTYLP